MGLYTIDVPTISAAWPEACRAVLVNGIAIGNTIELPDALVTHLSDPDVAMVPNGSLYSISYLEKYANQVIYETPLEQGYYYTYGNRLRNYDGRGCVDQIANVIKLLSAESETRRAVAVLYNPLVDYQSDTVPCMCLVDFKLRGGALHMCAYFRSHDIYAACPANLYALVRLGEYVVRQVSGNARLGTLTVVSNKAHIYDINRENAWRVAGRVG